MSFQAVVLVTGPKPKVFELVGKGDNWRVSEVSETLSGVYKFELVRYIYIITIADFLSHRKCIAQK